MRVRVLSEWAGSGPCGSLIDVDEAEGRARIASRMAEAAASALETNVQPADVVETAVQYPAGRGRKRGGAR